MSYIAPYARIKAFLGLADENVQSRPLEINFDDLLDVIRVLLSAIPVDETWYVNKYQDVGAFIGRGSFLNSGSHHFNVLGYFEGRRPFEHDTGPQRLPSTFAELKRLIAVSPVRERLVARVDYKVLLQMIRHLLVAVPVDEPWYQDHYPDVTAAIEDGRLRSAADHFARDGYFEGRWPFDMPVDEVWYLAAYSDVRDACARAHFASGADHFHRSGYLEGRLPAPNVVSTVHR